MPDNKHEAIAQALREQVRSGAYPPGTRLPAVREIAERYGAAVMTVRQALRTLEDEGVVEVRRGAGTYARSYAPVVRRGPGRLSRSVWGTGRAPWEVDAAGRTLRVDRLVVGPGPLPEEHAPAIDLEAGTQVVVRSRVYLLDDRPVMAATSYVPTDLASGTPIEQPNTGPGGIYARLAEGGHAPARFVERLRCRPASAEDRVTLDLARGAYVLRIVRTALTAAGRPVEVADMTATAADYELVYEFDA